VTQSEPQAREQAGGSSSNLRYKAAAGAGSRNLRDPARRPRKRGRWRYRQGSVLHCGRQAGGGGQRKQELICPSG